MRLASSHFKEKLSAGHLVTAVQVIDHILQQGFNAGPTLRPILYEKSLKQHFMMSLQLKI